MSSPQWFCVVLKAAGVYNLVWGLWAILAPDSAWKWMGLPVPNYPELWQCIGMIVGVYGLGYWIAATDPVRHWLIVLVGLLGKVFGPIGFVQAATAGRFPWSFGWTILTNDFIWWVPFGMILHHAWLSERKSNRIDASKPDSDSYSTEREKAFKASVLDSLDHVAIPVADVSAAVNWYQERFRCTVSHQDDTWALLQLENTRLAFVIPEQHPPHVAFTHPSADQFGRLKTHRDGTRSCYVSDPSGNPVEIMAI